MFINTISATKIILFEIHNKLKNIYIRTHDLLTFLLLWRQHL